MSSDVVAFDGVAVDGAAFDCVAVDDVVADNVAIGRVFAEWLPLNWQSIACISLSAAESELNMLLSSPAAFHAINIALLFDISATKLTSLNQLSSSCCEIGTSIIILPTNT